ncbi:hypothetical protein ACWGJW_33395, partial [Streptomyces nigrescens]
MLQMTGTYEPYGSLGEACDAAVSVLVNLKAILPERTYASEATEVNWPAEGVIGYPSLIKAVGVL